MSEIPAQKSVSKRFTPVGIIFATVGLLLFVYFVRKAEPARIWADIMQLGFGFVLILGISSIRLVVRTLAWMRCFEEPHRLKFGEAFRANVTGEALGNLMPLGVIVSAPAKAVLVRDKVPLMVGLSSIAVENLFYSLSVALFIFSGTVAFLFSFPLSSNWRTASIAVLCGIGVVIIASYVIVRRQWKFLSGTMEFFYARGIGRKLLHERRTQVRGLEERVYGFYARNRSRFLPILFLESMFHLAGVAEIYVTLYFIADTHLTLLAAFVLESVNRVINVVFKFIPLGLGVDEAGTELFTKILKFNPATGVSLAIIRKARILFWTSIGMLLLLRRGLTLRAVTKQTEAAAREVSAARSSAAVAAGESG
jgi:hypothetical protein